MAELFATLAATLGGGGAAAGGAAAAAGTAGAAASGFSLASIASFGATVAGGLASLSASGMKASALEAQGADEDMKAVQESINGRQDALTAMRKLNSDLASVVVAGYGSGLTPEGSIAAAQDEAIATGEANINMARENASFASASRRQQGYQLRREAQGERSGGLFSLVTAGLSYAGRAKARG